MNWKLAASQGAMHSTLLFSEVNEILHLTVTEMQKKFNPTNRLGTGRVHSFVYACFIFFPRFDHVENLIGYRSKAQKEIYFCLNGSTEPSHFFYRVTILIFTTAISSSGNSQHAIYA